MSVIFSETNDKENNIRLATSNFENNGELSNVVSKWYC